MAIRLNCPGCGLPMLQKEDEAGLIVPCPRCNAGVLVERPAEKHERAERPGRAAKAEGGFLDSMLANLSVLGLCIAVLAAAGGLFYLINHMFSAPDQMINDGIGTFGSQHLNK